MDKMKKKFDLNGREIREVFRIIRYRNDDCFDTETFATEEEAIKEAEWLWAKEKNDYICVSSWETIDEDGGFYVDYNPIWENGKRC